MQIVNKFKLVCKWSVEYIKQQYKGIFNKLFNETEVLKIINQCKETYTEKAQIW